MAQFGNVGIVGCGLLGASLGLALKERGLSENIVGIGRNQSTLDLALQRGAVDKTATSLEPLSGCHLVILATPIAKAVQLLSELASSLPAGVVITDVGSTKADICARAAALWPKGRPFVGAHPMAGSEKAGPEHARANLYEGAVCFVEQDSPSISDDALQTVQALWTSIGARVLHVEPRRHDEIVAYTSHLPHVVAACAAALAAERGDVQAFIGNGFRDVTRIAASRPEVWTEICLTNRNAMLGALRAYENWLGDFRHALEEEDAPAIERFFEQGKAAREGIVGK